MSREENDDLIEAMFIQKYLKNGYNSKQAYLTIRPEVTGSWASTRGREILNRPSVRKALEEAKGKLVQKIDKNALILRTGVLVDKAEEKEQFGAAIRGVELQGKFIGAFESGEGDEQKYINFITKISGNNVTVVNNLTEDSRKVEVHENS